MATALLLASGCREDPVLGPDDLDGQTPVPIYDIQTPHQGEPSMGSEVYLRSVVVTAFDTSPETRARREQDASGGYFCVEETGYTGGMVVQEIDGGTFSGVPLFNPALVPFLGEYVEFCLAGGDFHADSFCAAADSNRLTQLSEVTVFKVGETMAPTPISISSADLMNPARAEQFEGTLVRIDERLEFLGCQTFDTSGRPNCCVGAYDRYGNITTNGGLQFTNEFYTVPDGVTCVSSVTGIVTWFGHETDFGEYSVSPRGPGDVEVPADCLPD